LKIPVVKLIYSYISMLYERFIAAIYDDLINIFLFFP